ncbi:MAG: efflux RND transporter permease subunit [Campylobacterota bacterium]|nr:efflux RND transporter permease subunit [Campylobacterota bacterium]
MSRENESWIERLLKRPHFIISFLALFVFIGIIGYNKIDRKLFPDSNYPEVAVVIVEPSASAETIAANVAVPIEEELYTLDEIRRVTSSTIDEVTVISAEFEYTKDINNAVNDVNNAIAKIRSKLPLDIREPQVIKITEATPPVVVYAMIPEHGSSYEDLRELANGEIKHKLLKTPGVANVDVFGGYDKELQVIIDKNKLDQYGLTLGSVMALLQKNDREYALGIVINERSRYLIKVAGKQDKVSKIKSLALTPSLKLSDIAEVYFGHYENTALYYGNSQKAIALSVQRSITADVIRTIDAAEKVIDGFARRYPNITFQVTDTQKDTIKLSTDNMFESLRDAIVMATIVVFLFLASFRQVMIVLVTIPIVYGATIALMWLVGIDFNVITLTAIILALGLLLDDTVVVMENIERHHKEMHEEIHKAVFVGTKEIMFADLSGTVTTMIALAPVLFVGGYPQTIFQPLIGTLMLALAASYIISITAVPLLSLYFLSIQRPWIRKAEDFFHRYIEQANQKTVDFFRGAVELALDNKKAAISYFVVLLLLFVISVKGVMPVVGKELTPPMDTGELNVKITVDANLPIERSEEIVREANRIFNDEAKILRISASIGNEPGVMSIGAGGGVDQIAIKASYINRFERDATIWDIARELRVKLAKIPHVKTLEVAPAGGSPMKSIRGSVDVLLSATDFDQLEEAGGEIEKVMYQTKGLVSVSKTWENDKVVYALDIDEAEALQYGLTNDMISREIQMLVRGGIVANFPKQNSADYAVRVWLPKSQNSSMEKILSTLIPTKEGKVPLRTFASFSSHKEPTTITREGLNYTLDIYGNREKAAISHIMDSFDQAALEQNLALPDGVEMEQTGDIKQFKESAGRMIGAIAFAILFIFLTLVAMFNSIKISLMILVSIPLTIIGGSWILLVLDYHVSMPSMMGFILLSGIIVNNAILLIHFAMERMSAGLNKRDAMIEAITLRSRPVLMTAFSVSAGMLPVALGSAIGLEKLAPLGAVAIGGLIVGTLMTLLFIPLVFIWTVKENEMEEEVYE